MLLGGKNPPAHSSPFCHHTAEQEIQNRLCIQNPPGLKVKKTRWRTPLLSFISNYFAIFSSYPTAKRCRSVEHLTDSAVYISPYFLAEVGTSGIFSFFH